jgi:two-component system response regulator YcbB
MKIYIVDDDNNITRILEQIITDKRIGNIVGITNDSQKAIDEIRSLNPDIVIVDLLMPHVDGIGLIEEITGYNDQIKILMISQVTSKDMITKAYEKGASFYINKPINAVEVLNVLAEIVNYMEADKRLKIIRNVFDFQGMEALDNDTVMDQISGVLKKIGIVRSAASEEIYKVVSYMVTHPSEVRELSVKEICQKFTPTPKILEQKIRRAASMGLENLSYLGVEDNLNEVFLEYANTLYHFKEVKKEMDFIRGHSEDRGKVNLRKFLEGLTYYIRL